MSKCDTTCKGCVYLEGFTARNTNYFICNYFLKTGERRGCPAGKGCTRRTTGSKKKFVDRRRPVDKYSLDGEFIESFESVRAAAFTIRNDNDKVFATTASVSIYNVCAGKGKTAYGFIWKYHNKK